MSLPSPFLGIVPQERGPTSSHGPVGLPGDGRVLSLTPSSQAFQGSDHSVRFWVGGNLTCLELEGVGAGPPLMRADHRAEALRGGGAPTSQGLLGKGDRSPLRLLTATNLCFAERNVYTSEVLAVVMQQLMEQSPLPMLLMRTVIQSLTMYPRLGGFVMNILSRLIMKQVTRPTTLGSQAGDCRRMRCPETWGRTPGFFSWFGPCPKGALVQRTSSTMTGRLPRQYSPLGVTASDSCRGAGWRVRLLGGGSGLREAHVPGAVAAPSQC